MILVLAALAMALTVTIAFFAPRQDAYTVTARFQNAGQVVPGNDVRIGGRRVGAVGHVTLTDQGEASVLLEIDRDAAPLPTTTTAAIRSQSLVGSANRYVVLDPGRPTNARIPDGGDIAAARTESPVELDQVLSALDPRSRAGLRYLIRGSATSYGRRGLRARQSLRYLAPALFGTTELTRKLSRDEPGFQRLLSQGATAVGAVASRRGDLVSLVDNAGSTTEAIATESDALSRSLTLFPRTLRKSNTTLVNLRSTLDDLDPFLREMRPATRQLVPLFDRLTTTLRVAQPTVADLAQTMSRPGRDNDLADLAGGAPRLRAITSRALPRAVRTMNSSQSEADSLREYTPDLLALISNLGAASAPYDIHGHYLRAAPAMLALSYDAAGNQLKPLVGGDRLAELQTGREHRCPGAATQRPADDSAPVPAAGCDPSISLPGP